MILQLLRLAGWCTIFGVGILLFNRKKVALSPFVKRITLVGIIVLWIITSIFPPELLFVNFSTPEDAYRYTHSVEPPYYMIEGASTSMIYGINEDGAYEIDILSCTENRWKPGNVLSFKTYLFEVDENTHIQMYRHRKTGECYLSVLCEGISVHEIEDDIGTQFIQDQSFLDSEYTKYHAYIGNVEDEYTFTMAGKQCVLLLK